MWSRQSLPAPARDVVLSELLSRAGSPELRDLSSFIGSQDLTEAELERIASSELEHLLVLKAHKPDSLVVRRALLAYAGSVSGEERERRLASLRTSRSRDVRDVLWLNPAPASRIEVLRACMGGVLVEPDQFAWLLEQDASEARDELERDLARAHPPLALKHLGDLCDDAALALPAALGSWHESARPQRERVFEHLRERFTGREPLLEAALRDEAAALTPDPSGSWPLEELNVLAAAGLVGEPVPAGESREDVVVRAAGLDPLDPAFPSALVKRLGLELEVKISSGGVTPREALEASWTGTDVKRLVRGRDDAWRAEAAQEVEKHLQRGKHAANRDSRLARDTPFLEALGEPFTSQVLSSLRESGRGVPLPPGSVLDRRVRPHDDPDFVREFLAVAAERFTSPGSWECLDRLGLEFDGTYGELIELCCELG
jgi:hypothetical protein